MRSIHIFSILVVYIILQFAWWSYLLIDLNDEVFEHRIENVHLKNPDVPLAKAEEEKLVEKLNQRRWMVLGEGSVFLFLLGWVSYRTFRSFKKEIELARLQKNFLLSITHEFKSPLASIRLYLQTIQKFELDKEKQSSFINKAIADTDRLNILVENTLFANTIDYKGYSFSKEPINLSALVRLVIQNYNQLPDIQHKISSKIQDPIMINGDKLAISMMLGNLIENAAKYSPAGSEIEVDLKKEDGKIILSVSDMGIGIPGKEKKKVFDKFYRIGNEETRKTKGTGLGLYLVKYIVENHSGSISILDNHPKGSVFRTTFKTA